MVVGIAVGRKSALPILCELSSRGGEGKTLTDVSPPVLSLQVKMARFSD
jgi:hypothetical protein